MSDTNLSHPGAEKVEKPQRLASIDTYRGIVMFLMLAEVLELFTLAEHYPGNRLFEWIKFHTTHVAWVGCSLHDMIQPSFSFLVGVALPFSLAARRKRGDSLMSMTLHAAWRAILLVALGIMLRSLSSTQTNFFFVDTLTQIGLGYFALFVLGFASIRVHVAVISLTLLTYWQLFGLWPLPDVSFSWTAVGVPVGWPHKLSGFSAHWNKNMNPAWYFDTWFMNLFPREDEFKFNAGGYCTLNFIPTFATMALGTVAGKLLLGRSSTPSNPEAPQTSEPQSAWPVLGVLLGGGIVLALLGVGLDYLGLCPVVKRIWTPAWVLYSGGLCFITLGALHWICDIRGWRMWATPLLIIGANSIVAYVMSWTLEAPIKAFWLRHLGPSPFQVAGEAWEPVLLGLAVLITMWLILLWLFKQRIFVRI